MDSDKAFFGTILALFAMMCGHPVIALIIFMVAIV
jgi:hypothetical protein